jgi:hypothetical protein
LSDHLSDELYFQKHHNLLAQFKTAYYSLLQNLLTKFSPTKFTFTKVLLLSFTAASSSSLAIWRPHRHLEIGYVGTSGPGRQVHRNHPTAQRRRGIFAFLPSAAGSA